MKNVSLELNKKSIPEKVKFGFAVLSQMSSSFFFPTPEPTMTDLKTATINLEDAMVAAANKGNTLTQDMYTREAEFDLVLKSLGGYVTAVANQYPNPEEVITSANMKMKRYTKPNITTLSAKQGDLYGSIKLRRKAVKGIVSYRIQMSSDSGKTWVDVFIASKATSIIVGLTSGQRYLFRVAVILSNVQFAFCDSISVLVD